MKRPNRSAPSCYRWRSLVPVITVLVLAAFSLALSAARAPEATAASTCATNGYRITARAGVSCTTAKRVLRNYLNRSSTSGWSCSRSRRECSGSGLSIDEYRYFRFR